MGILVGLIIAIGIIRSVYSLSQKQGVVGERKAVLSSLEAKRQALLNQLEEATSAAFIERAARNKLGLVKEGEKVVIIDRSNLQRLSEENNPLGRVLPSWKQWWQLFF